MKEKLIRFMMGRYGIDQLGQFLAVATFLLMVLGIFTHPIVYYIGIAGMIYMYFRIFSKNRLKRSAENRNWLDKKKRVWNLKKTHKVFRCPTCKQKIKVPKGRGKIEIRCQKCDTRFVKRS